MVHPFSGKVQIRGADEREMEREIEILIFLDMFFRIMKRMLRSSASTTNQNKKIIKNHFSKSAL
jgi:hypothetical protein